MGMAKVWCGAIDCEHNKNNKCRLKEINLVNGIVSTMWQGSMQYWKCRNFEESKASKEIRKLLRGERREGE